MSALWQQFWSDESGQGLTEYALIIALVSIGLIAVLIFFRDTIGQVFEKIAAVLDSAPSDGYEPGS